MCGIAGIYLKNKRAKVSQDGIEAFCDRLLLEIEHRGRHATGYMSVGWDKSVCFDKSDKCATDFVKERDPFQKGAQAVLLHTRFFTKGKPDVMGNNHPVTYNSCFTVHNGHIYNDDELFKDEEIKRNFEVDSEIIPALLDKHTLESPDTIRAALEKLGGAMAIAAMDPVRYPGKLLLARGDSSPLYIFENPNVIVWASEHSAIKDTWGDIVGTPPHGTKIKFIPEGRFFIAQDYQDLGDGYEFTPKKKPSYVRPASQGRQGWPTPVRNDLSRPWDSKGPFNTWDDFKEALKEYRATDAILARRLSLRESYTKEDMADVEGTLQWYRCPICCDMILRQDMRKHLRYDSICKDCYEVTIDGWKKAGERAAESEEAADSNPLTGIDIPEIPAIDRKNLESWAQKEAILHRYTLSEMSDLTGFSMHALDFLMFRTFGKAHEYGLGMTALKMALTRGYGRVSEVIHTDFGKEILDEADLARKVTHEAAQEIADQQMYPWTAFTETVAGDPESRTMYVCEIHGERFPYGSHCHACVFSDFDEEGEAWGSEDARRGRDSSDDVGGESEVCGIRAWHDDVEEADTQESLEAIGLVKCMGCNTWCIGECVVCATREPSPGDVEIVEITETVCSCKTTRDRKCKGKLSMVVANSLIGKQKGYCHRHWNKCSASKCNNQANFTGLDGNRFCHGCSRSKSGVSDVAAMKDGTTSIIMEVR